MIELTSKGRARKFITRALAAGMMLGIYVSGLVGVTGVVMTTGVSAAMARGRGGRGGGGRGRGRGGNVGAAIGAGVALGIIGGAIAADQARRSVDYCMRRFRSYDPQSGTYMGSDGYRHPCP